MAVEANRREKDWDWGRDRDIEEDRKEKRSSLSMSPSPSLQSPTKHKNVHKDCEILYFCQKLLAFKLLRISFYSWKRSEPKSGKKRKKEGEGDT